MFTSKLGTFKGQKIDLRFKDGTNAKYSKARPLPFLLKSKVGIEFDRLVSEKVLFPVKTSKCRTPIVPVIRPNCTVRICEDFKIFINPFLEEDNHPMPRIDDLLVQIDKGTTAKINLANAYEQLFLSVLSKKMTTILLIVYFSLYNRLFNGVKTARAEFQRVINQLFKG